MRGVTMVYLQPVIVSNMADMTQHTPSHSARRKILTNLIYWSQGHNDPADVELSVIR